MHKIFKNGAIQVSSEESMVALGREIAATLSGGEVLGLVGDLGAGKTHLVRGILEGLGAAEPAASPTFSWCMSMGMAACRRRISIFTA